MPPQRTTLTQRSGAPPKPIAKPIKSERTHEENQERAYIAASRRSDRSLEARIESARRASEIHKRRTGRALRVTESDVVNEEMYEEEDDEITHAYRNLSMLMGGSPIDRRFAAYYQHQLHMRNIVDRALTDSIARANSGLQQNQMQPMNGGLAQNQMTYIHPNQPHPHQLTPQQIALLQQQQEQRVQQQTQQLSFPFFTQSAQTQPFQPVYRQHPYMAHGQSRGNGGSTHMPAVQAPLQPPRMMSARESQSPTPALASAPLTPNTPNTPLSMSPPNSAMTIQQSRLGYQSSSSPQIQPLPMPNPDIETPAVSLFPFTDEIPPEAARFFAGQMHNMHGAPYGDVGLLDNLYTTATTKGYGTDAADLKTLDHGHPSGQFKWQTGKHDSAFPASDVAFAQAQQDGLMNAFLEDVNILQTPAADGFDTDHLQQYVLPDVEAAAWDQYMNSDWLETTIV